ncbi:MAG TPA: L,D-transpeptidase [Conexibacter sp.]|nr:L,D-transpeptidase [Conexibacter sp.]
MGSGARRSGAAALLLCGALAVAAGGCGSSSPDVGLIAPAVAPVSPKHVSARTQALRAGTLIAQVKRSTGVRDAPGGRVLARISPQTEYHSPTILPVLRRRGAWYAVVTAALPNNRVGWISAHARLAFYTADYRIDVSLRHRNVVVRHGQQVIARFPVAIGAPATPTPTGRYAITDKLFTHDQASPYGCCILALSAHQPHIPQGWGGGDRIGLHATAHPETIGSAVSFGCLRAPQAEMRRLVAIVPLGTVVTIHAT